MPTLDDAYPKNGGHARPTRDGERRLYKGIWSRTSIQASQVDSSPRGNGALTHDA
jgi:hypothetical protein